MNEALKKLAAVAAVLAAQPGLASDIDSARVDNASALVAIQLSSEVGENLSRELVRDGMSKIDADALVFRIVDGAARCTIRRLEDHDLPQVASFLDLLASNEEMSTVTTALDKMYSRQQLDAMQSEVSRTVLDCLEISMRLPESVPNRPAAVG